MSGFLERFKGRFVSGRKNQKKHMYKWYRRPKRHDLTIGDAPDIAPLPDLFCERYPWLTASMALRQVSKNATRCIRVRRDSDDAETDIGFDSSTTKLDVEALHTFCTGASCYVVSMYAQQQDAVYWTQGTADSQPLIYENEDVVRDHDGNVAMYAVNWDLFGGPNVTSDFGAGGDQLLFMSVVSHKEAPTIADEFFPYKDSIQLTTTPGPWKKFRDADSGTAFSQDVQTDTSQTTGYTVPGTAISLGMVSDSNGVLYINSARSEGTLSYATETGRVQFGSRSSTGCYASEFHYGQRPRAEGFITEVEALEAYQEVLDAWEAAPNVTIDPDEPDPDPDPVDDVDNNTVFGYFHQWIPHLYGLKKLGAGDLAIKVKRFSDNTSLDIGFDGYGVDETAIETFCTGTDCRVTTIYDQKGTAHLTNNGSAPYIYKNDVLVRDTEGNLALEVPPGADMRGGSLSLDGGAGFSSAFMAVIGLDSAVTDVNNRLRFPTSGDFSIRLRATGIGAMDCANAEVHSHSYPTVPGAFTVGVLAQEGKLRSDVASDANQVTLATGGRRQTTPVYARILNDDDTDSYLWSAMAVLPNSPAASGTPTEQQYRNAIASMEALFTCTDTGAGTTTFEARVVADPVYVLDDYDALQGGVSLKQRAASATNCIRIRRGSDDAELDIGFVDKVVDTASIETHCTGTTCYIARWYDQLGDSTHDLVQAVSASQPIIYQSGAVTTDAEGNVAPLMTGTQSIVMPAQGLRYTGALGRTLVGVYGCVNGTAEDELFTIGQLHPNVGINHEGTVSGVSFKRIDGATDATVSSSISLPGVYTVSMTSDPTNYRRIVLDDFASATTTTIADNKVQPIGFTCTSATDTYTPLELFWGTEHTVQSDADYQAMHADVKKAWYTTDSNGDTVNPEMTGGGSDPDPDPVTVADPFLTTHTWAQHFYSLRAGTEDYAGDLLQVTRDSDGATAEIAHDSGTRFVDESALETFCTGTVCRVSIWYDQDATDAMNLVQTVAADMPIIYENGAVVRNSDGQVAMRLAGSSLAWSSNQVSRRSATNSVSLLANIGMDGHPAGSNNFLIGYPNKLRLSSVNTQIYGRDLPGSSASMPSLFTPGTDYPATGTYPVGYYTNNNTMLVKWGEASAEPLATIVADAQANEALTLQNTLETVNVYCSEIVYTNEAVHTESQFNAAYTDVQNMWTGTSSGGGSGDPGDVVVDPPPVDTGGLPFTVAPTVIWEIDTGPNYEKHPLWKRPTGGKFSSETDGTDTYLFHDLRREYLPGGGCNPEYMTGCHNSDPKKWRFRCESRWENQNMTFWDCDRNWTRAANQPRGWENDIWFGSYVFYIPFGGSGNLNGQYNDKPTGAPTIVQQHPAEDKDDGEQSGSAHMVFRWNANKITASGNYRPWRIVDPTDPNNKGKQIKYTFNDIPLTYNQKFRLTWIAAWSPYSNGRIQVFINDTLHDSRRGPNASIDRAGPYMKWGIYAHDWQSGRDTKSQRHQIRVYEHQWGRLPKSYYNQM